MKKIVTIILSLAMVLTLFTSCNQKQDNSSEDNKAQTEQRTLTIYAPISVHEGEDAAWEELCRNFEKEYSYINVDIQFSGTWEDGITGLTAAKMNGEHPDIYISGCNEIRQSLAAAGMILDISSLIKPIQERFMPGAIDGITLGGRIWGVPYDSSDTLTMFYNADLFKQYDLPVPTTYQDLVKCAQVFQKNGIIPMIHNGTVTSMWPMWFMETYEQTSGNASQEKIESWLRGESSFDNAETIAAFTQIKQFVDDGVLSQDSYGTNTAAIRALFAQGKCAMFLGGTWSYSAFAEEAKGVYELGAFEFPVCVSGAVSKQATGCGKALVVPSFCDQKNLDIIELFLEYATRVDVATPIFAARGALVPSIIGVPSSSSDTFANTITTVHSKNTVVFLDWIWPAEINDAMAAMIPAVMSGQKTPEQAVKEIQKTYEDLVKQTDYKYDFYKTWTDADWALVTPSTK